MDSRNEREKRQAPFLLAPARDLATKPNLFIVGAPKCGTTAWVRYLSSHPQIFFPMVKEPHYFSPDMPKPEGFIDLPDQAAYLSLFSRSGNAKIIGEASVRYLQSCVAARNIRLFNPDAKIIIFVRDQEDFLPSLHNQLVFNKEECITDFETAWRLSGKRDEANTSPYCRHPKFLDYVAAGRFSEQVERYFDEFPEEQIRVFHFRDWSGNPRRTYLEILSFLGVPDDGRMDFPKVNPSRQRRTKWLWKLHKQPPHSARAVAALIKRMTGFHTLRIGHFIGWLDSKKGGQTRVSEALRQEIAAYFEPDNELLKRRIHRVEEDARPALRRQFQPRITADVNSR